MSQYNEPASLEAIFRDLQNRLSALERTKVTRGSGAPPTGATEPYVDETNSRVYYKVSGVWKSAALT